MTVWPVAGDFSSPRRPLPWLFECSYDKAAGAPPPQPRSLATRTSGPREQGRVSDIFHGLAIKTTQSLLQYVIGHKGLFSVETQRV